MVKKAQGEAERRLIIQIIAITFFAFPVEDLETMADRWPGTMSINHSIISVTNEIVIIRNKLSCERISQTNELLQIKV